MIHANHFTSEPVIGQLATGIGFGVTRSGKLAYLVDWSGVYEGVKPSEWDGEPVHFFRDGDIGGVAQGCHASPVAKFV